jgi:tRNA(Ile)-lysidine synthase
VSGGPDSLALLLLAHAAFPGGFEVATVDHGLRAESADEAARVARVCAERGIAHATLRPALTAAGNLQARARAARYAALEAWAEERALAAVLTAHHLDDQAETLLMRLNRGVGVRGAAAMQRAACIPGGTRPLLRPLLGWRRAELAEVVASERMEPARDPSNDDLRFERTRARTALAATPWLDPEALAASAAHFAEADALVAALAAREWDERVGTAGDGLLYRAPTGQRIVALRVIERILAALACEGEARGKEIARLHAALSRGETATLAGVKASPDAEGWRFDPAPPRRGR